MAYDLLSIPCIQEAYTNPKNSSLPELICTMDFEENIWFQAPILFEKRVAMEVLLSNLCIYYFHNKKHFSMPIYVITNMETSDKLVVITANGLKCPLTLQFYESQPAFEQMLSQYINSRTFVYIIPRQYEEQAECNRLQFLINTQSSSFENLISSAEKLKALIGKLTQICREESVDEDVLKSIGQADRDRCLAALQPGDMKLLFSGLEESKFQEYQIKNQQIFIMDQAYGIYCNQLLRNEEFADFSEFKNDCLRNGYELRQFNSKEYVGKCSEAVGELKKRMMALAAEHDKDGAFQSVLRYDLHDFESDIVEELTKSGEYLVYDGFECRRYYLNTFGK